MTSFNHDKIYVEYMSGFNKDTKLIFNSLQQIADIMLYNKFLFYDDPYYDDIKSAVYELIWIKICHDDLPYLKKGIYTYFTQSLYHAALKERARLIDHHEFVSLDEVEDRNNDPFREYDSTVSLYDILNNLYDEILCEVRFCGKEYEACDYILSNTMASTPVIPAHIKSKFGITNVNFYINYISVKLKCKLYKYRSSIRSIGIDFHTISVRFNNFCVLDTEGA